MPVVQQVLFALVLGFVGWTMFRRISVIKKTIALGKPEDLTDRPGERLSTMLRIAFGQKKMFDRPVVGVLHFLVYAGFLLINLEVLEIVLDGLFGTHRLLAPLLGGFYPILIGFFELLALGVLVACSIFLIRRNTGSVPRLSPARHRELNGWPVKDANTILVIEIVLMIAILSMNAADSLLQERGELAATGPYLVSRWLMPLFSGLGDGALHAIERGAWWFHILGIFAFAVYVTYSKHLHIFLAFPNTYFTRLKPKGEMENMPAVTKEVKLMLGLQTDSGEAPAEPGRFGAKDVMDLSWKNLMDAYSCTECGRCTASCPANITGKKLSPRKIMMDTRDRLEDLGRNMLANGGEIKDDGKFLLGDYITAEELRACTTCQACVEACPVLINPLDIILQLRRYQVMEESDAPASWNSMFQNLENNQAPWKFSPGDRFNWAEKVN
ncbi:(Fe-S)-binding protein [Siphonobacter aquaeclarae]|uniref:4Fe-4S dicluster domain-containing protein n=1 Tax=Siphonobacter aquaeclarae TaxID=563176 RepID=A0A1G9MAC6_9BACT|nr:(Fe-S)-binding protein [Siphonobacter aquaeclarae]SDL71216.1 4Fe-4S dicluster domain-containing protein [Siphonobacter aquaeclarae]